MFSLTIMLRKSTAGVITIVITPEFVQGKYSIVKYISYLYDKFYIYGKKLIHI